MASIVEGIDSSALGACIEYGLGWRMKGLLQGGGGRYVRLLSSRIGWYPIIRKEQWTSGKLAHLVGRLRWIGSDWGGTRLRGSETIENRTIGESYGE